MPFKPNYDQQRAERSRLKQAKKEAKLREKEDARGRRKTEPDGEPPTDPAVTDAPAGTHAAGDSPATAPNRGEPGG